MSVDRLTLVELIEGEADKLSPRGWELWERLEVHVEMSAPEETHLETSPDPEQIEVANLIAELPWQEQGILERLMELLAGLRSSDYAESRGQPGEPRRNEAVILAAALKERQEGQMINPDMSPEQAVACLREPG
jgi:hypothetical protein